MQSFLRILGAIVLAASAAAGAELKSDHVTVNYNGIDEPHAKAISRVVERAMQVAADEFGFDMPAMITVVVDARPGNTVRLFTDGSDHLTLSIRSEADLRPPQQSGIFNLYGMCHEIGHNAMYRPIKNHGFLSTAAAEGWAHYVGSRIVDRVYATEGEKAWADPYDYRADGMQRLDAQLARGGKDPVVQGAGLWKQLAGIVGDKQLAAVFKAWGSATIDPADPAPALRAATQQVSQDPRLADWWKLADPLMFTKRPRSGFTAKTAAVGDLSGKPLELARDDGKPAKMSSMAGGGHAVVLETQGEGWYLTSVKIYGSRYGAAQAPREDFHVWLCDADGKAIRDFAFPYSSFARGQAAWVTLKTAPTQLPKQFMICVGFNPTGSKGVYVYYDAQRDGDSRIGLPGGEMQRFDKGDWMIRATVDQAKAADALR